VTRDLCKALGGKIQATSKENLMTKFSLIIPLRLLEDEENSDDLIICPIQQRMSTEERYLINPLPDSRIFNGT
jgi:hypothetical protein